MASSGKQVKNGKAFEYAIAIQYSDFLKNHGLKVQLTENKAYKKAKEYFDSFDDSIKSRFLQSASATIDTLTKIEPGLTTESSQDDVLNISLNDDGAGEKGDVRDVVFKRDSWEIGFSAKNNNDAVKHSRLGKELDFCEVWFGVPCSQEYWDDIKPIFDYIESMIQQNKTWAQLGKEKETRVYVPLLNAFKNEIARKVSQNKKIPEKLIKYLIGARSFYKIIKDDNHNLVVVKAFNVGGKLNMDYSGTKSRYKIPKINLPSRVIEFEFKPKSQTTLNMVLDQGWEISFRIHNASEDVERSLKFDIQLLGNPPILFTQHIFQ